jgi:hypothetical protein
MNEKDISRFLFDKKQVRDNKTIRHTAFIPPQNFRLSVYKTDSLSSAEIFEIGSLYVEPARGRVANGVAQITSEHVASVELSIDNDGDPHPRHSNIVGWFGDSVRDRELAVKLASEATLLVKSDTSSN